MLIATTDGLTLATTSAMLGSGGAWLVEMDGSVSFLGTGVDSSDLAGVVVLVVALGGGEVSVLGARAHPVAKARDKIRLRATAKYFMFVFFMIYSITKEVAKR